MGLSGVKKMKIKRTVGGKEVEFELTDSELFNAFVEQQHRFDRSDCEYYLDNYYSDATWYGTIEKSLREDLIEEAAHKLRWNIDHDDTSFDYALQFAFDDAIQDIVMKDEE